MTENKDMKHTLFKKQDLILIAMVLAAAALLFLGTKLMHKSPAEVVEISVDGNVVETTRSRQKVRNSRSMVHPAAQTI